MYMAHVCFYVGCNDCVGFCGKVCCVALLKICLCMVLAWIMC